MHARASSLIHSTVTLETPHLHVLLSLLDGTRDRSALADALQAAFPDELHAELEKQIESDLQFLARTGVLEA
jgi:hypothetical protein